MDGLERKLEEDKALRDAARRLVEADLGFVKGEATGGSLGKRAAEDVARSSMSVVDRAADYAKAHPLVVASGILALLLIVLRKPLLDLVIALLGSDEDGDQPAPRPIDDDEPPAANAELCAPADRSSHTLWPEWRKSR